MEDKSRPLMESKPGHMVCARLKQRKTRPTVRKVKRDSDGNVLGSDTCLEYAIVQHYSKIDIEYFAQELLLNLRMLVSVLLVSMVLSFGVPLMETHLGSTTPVQVAVRVMGVLPRALP